MHGRAGLALLHVARGSGAGRGRLLGSGVGVPPEASRRPLPAGLVPFQLVPARAFADCGKPVRQESLNRTWLVYSERHRQTSPRKAGGMVPPGNRTPARDLGNAGEDPARWSRQRIRRHRTRAGRPQRHPHHRPDATVVTTDAAHVGRTVESAAPQRAGPIRGLAETGGIRTGPFERGDHGPRLLPPLRPRTRPAPGRDWALPPVANDRCSSCPRESRASSTRLVMRDPRRAGTSGRAGLRPAAPILIPAPASVKGVRPCILDIRAPAELARLIRMKGLTPRSGRIRGRCRDRAPGRRPGPRRRRRPGPRAPRRAGGARRSAAAWRG